MIDTDEPLRRNKPEHNIIQPERVVQHAHGLFIKGNSLPRRIGHLVAGHLLRRICSAAWCGKQK